MTQDPMFDLVRWRVGIAGHREKTFLIGEMTLKQTEQTIDRFQHGGGITPVNETGDHDDLIKNFFVFTVDFGVTYRY